MSNAKDIIVSAIVSALTALVVVGLVLWMGHGNGNVKAGTVDTSCQGFTTCLSDLYLTTTGGGSGSLRAAGTFIADGLATFNGTLKMSSVGTTITGMNFGTCFIHPYAATIAASTTAQVDCQGTANFAGTPGSALAGIAYGDTVVAKLGTTTVGTIFGGLRLRGAEASTTAGYIALFVENDTGATYTWSTSQVASGTAQYIAAR